MKLYWHTHQRSVILLAAAAFALASATVAWAYPDYRYPRTDFGSRVAGVSGDVAVWWCDATWKVGRERPAPEAATPAATMSAARNDFEAVQVVVRPTKELRQLTAALGALTGPDGAVIPAQDIEVLRVYYHHVTIRTDRLTVLDWWPDALPPLHEPVDVAAGQNQPLWVLVHVRKDTKPGDYAGALQLKAQGWSATVPIKLHVWSFTLPEKNHLDTAFGLSLPSGYHRLKTEAQQRQVWDMYMQKFADHRLSPYDPIPFDGIRRKFLFDAQPPRTEFDFSAFDRAMAEAIKKYHVTNFRLGISGVGGSLRGPNGQVYKEGSPQFDGVFSSQVKQLESHLREKGWLQMAYVYWIDEPFPDNYPYVQAGMDRIKKYAPGIPTMITLNMPDDKLTLDRSIDIWCPQTNRYTPATAAKHRAQGNRYWWYLCTLPKAPRLGLFIDRAATEMRIWGWQTWQRDISGLLIWATTYWSAQQNPYLDPMAYISGTQPADRRYWGNGDGRLLYPPLAAADLTASDKGPILEPPASCVRLEMLREGIEDYEYLWLLRDLIGKKRAALSADQVKAYEALLAVPAAITTDITEFTTAPQPIYERRAAIAAAIEELQKK